MVHLSKIQALVALSALQGALAAPHVSRRSQCEPFQGNIGDGWTSNAKSNLYVETNDNTKLILVGPGHGNYKTLYDKAEDANYNTVAGDGPTFNYHSPVLYGILSADIKAPDAGGAVSALIFKSEETKDEIDFELLANPDDAQTNYFWGKNIVYGKNSRVHKGDVSGTYHRYTIDWSPDSIKWYIDGNMIREETRASTNGEYPASPSMIGIGLWDGSKDPGTSHWAQGPIDWDAHKDISMYVKNIKLECPY
ncbi:glycosyl hydrolases family 16-domain-containing protein [Gongronella butleri]|nr:glycosyl hydrolases family 16-domain-containing protein [Gongronella butleri]